MRRHDPYDPDNFELGPKREPRKMAPAEKRWVAELERVLLRCPPTLSLMTIGDRELVVLDRARELENLHDGRAEWSGIALTSARSGCKIHGCSA